MCIIDTQEENEGDWSITCSNDWDFHRIDVRNVYVINTVILQSTLAPHPESSETTKQNKCQNTKQNKITIETLHSPC